MFALLVSSLASAAIVAVPGDAPTIQEGMEAARPGDTVEVAPGSYQERLDFGGRDIEVVATGGPGVTTVDGRGGTVVVIGPGGRISGFTITGGVASFGAGMAAHGVGSRIDGNIFDGNEQTSGGSGAAIDVNSASPIIERNLFVRQSCDTQFLSGVVSVLNASQPLIANNVFADNECRAINLSLPDESAPRIINNTVVHNPAGIRVSYYPGADLVVRNNLVASNDVGIESDPGLPMGELTWQANLVYDNGVNYQSTIDPTGTDGNLSVDPELVDPAGGDYHLIPGSPAVDAGNDDAAPVDDFDGAARPVDGDGDGTAVTDIGAFELPAGAPPVANAGPDQTVETGATVTLDGSGSGATAALTFAWTQTAGEAVTLDGGDTELPEFVAPATPGVLTFSLEIDDGTETASDTVDVTVVAPGAGSEDPAGEGDEPAEGCGCSGSGQASALSCVVALLLVVRRRRDP